MSVIATCGHTLTEEEELGTTIAVKSYCKDGSKAIDYPTVCNKCLKWYRKKRFELRTEEQRERWLGSSLPIVTKPKLVDPIAYLCDAIEKSNVKVTFGLQPHHIEKIESELKRWDDMIQEGDTLKIGWRKFDKSFWDKMGKDFGWCPFTLALYYFEYMEEKLK